MSRYEISEIQEIPLCAICLMTVCVTVLGSEIVQVCNGCCYEQIFLI
jgi:hypothetical protein